MNLPRLSVVVPNYNHGAFLPTCLNALLNQSVPPFEVIVIDDASTDNSMAVIEEFAARHPNIRAFRNDRNRGVVYNLNLGLELARGEFVFFPAADDEVQAGLFEKSLRLLAEHPQAALSCTVSQWHDVATGLSWHMAVGMADRPCFLSPAELVQLGRQGRLIICTSSAIMRTGPLRKIGGFNSELRWHCDWFAVTVPALRHGICFVPESLSDFYLHPTSYYNRGRRTPEHRAVLARLLEQLSAPACADVAPLIRESAVLSLFGLPVLGLLARRKYRALLSPLLVWRAARRSAELVGKRLLPRPVARFCLHLFYRRKNGVSVGD